MTSKNKKAVDMPRRLRLLYIASQLGEDKRPIWYDAIGGRRGCQTRSKREKR